MRIAGIAGTSFAVAAILALAAGSAAAYEPTDYVKKILAKHKLSADIFKGKDAELAVPQAWIDSAKKEGKFRPRLNLSAKNFTKLGAAFQARYPFVKDIEYTRGVGRDRAVKPLLAYKAGNTIVDVVIGFTNLIDQYEAADALVDLRGMPNWKLLEPDVRDNEKGLWGSWKKTYWCLSYNKDKVKKADLPKTWVDLVENPLWRNGRVGIANRPQLWISHLWGANGVDWGRDYTKKVFTVLKPQLRKEAINGIMKLAAVGEFDIAIPSADYRVEIQVKQGAPIAFHCPEPVPVNYGGIGIFKRDSNLYTSLLFLNWVLSKEGQIASNNADGSTPVHPELQGPPFLVYPEATMGKKAAVKTTKMIEEIEPVMFKQWNQIWLDSGGPGRKKRGKK